MKKASMLVFRRITPADFFNIYKERGAEEGGGGQSYIDIDTSGVSIPGWQNFFSGISPTAKKGGPLWNFQVHSLGIGGSHVWMPPLVQGKFRPSEHVIECGHVSGLTLRLFTCRGPVWRYADQVQITYDALKLALWLPLVFLIPI